MLDPDARAGTLRALALLAKASRLATSYALHSAEWKDAVEAAERAFERALRHYEEFKAGHPSHLRTVRVVRTALEQGEALAVALMTAFDADDVDDLVLDTEKLERSIDRAAPEIPSISAETQAR